MEFTYRDIVHHPELRIELQVDAGGELYGKKRSGVLYDSSQYICSCGVSVVIQNHMREDGTLIDNYTPQL